MKNNYKNNKKKKFTLFFIFFILDWFWKAARLRAERRSDSAYQEVRKNIISDGEKLNEYTAWVLKHLNTSQNQDEKEYFLTYKYFIQTIYGYVLGKDFCEDTANVLRKSLKYLDLYKENQMSLRTFAGYASFVRGDTESVKLVVTNMFKYPMRMEIAFIKENKDFFPNTIVFYQMLLKASTCSPDFEPRWNDYYVPSIEYRVREDFRNFPDMDDNGNMPHIPAPLLSQRSRLPDEKFTKEETIEPWLPKIFKRFFTRPSIPICGPVSYLNEYRERENNPLTKKDWVTIAQLASRNSKAYFVSGLLQPHIKLRISGQHNANRIQVLPNAEVKARFERELGVSLRMANNPGRITGLLQPYLSAYIRGPFNSRFLTEDEAHAIYEKNRVTDQMVYLNQANLGDLQYHGALSRLKRDTTYGVYGSFSSSAARRSARAEIDLRAIIKKNLDITVTDI